jgi:hypothetical protein
MPEIVDDFARVSRTEAGGRLFEFKNCRALSLCG